MLLGEWVSRSPKSRVPPVKLVGEGWRGPWPLRLASLHGVLRPLLLTQDSRDAHRPGVLSGPGPGVSWV